MKLLFNVCEKIIFLVVNLFFSCTYLSLFSILYISDLFTRILHKDSVLSYETNGDSYFLLWVVFFWLVLLFVKFFIFQWVYRFEKFFPNTSCFLGKYINDKAFRLNISKYAILLDIFFVLLQALFIGFKDFTVDEFWYAMFQNTLIEQYLGSLWISLFLCFILCGGVTPCYLFFKWVSNRKLKRLSFNSTKTNISSK